MRYATVMLLLFLSACTSVPVLPQFPAAPDLLMQHCADLKTISQHEVSIVDFVKTVAENYTSYHECSAKNTAWQEWYTQQKKLWDSTP